MVIDIPVLTERFKRVSDEPRFWRNMREAGYTYCIQLRPEVVLPSNAAEAAAEAAALYEVTVGTIFFKGRPPAYEELVQKLPEDTVIVSEKRYYKSLVDGGATPLYKAELDLETLVLWIVNRHWVTPEIRQM